jgi:hypothetical protein
MAVMILVTGLYGLLGIAESNRKLTDSVTAARALGA